MKFMDDDDDGSTSTGPGNSVDDGHVVDLVGQALGAVRRSGRRSR